MIGDIGVISTFCNSWPKDSPKRYYVKLWEDKFEDRLYSYYREHNIESADKKSKIHVFFDDSGVLKITQCEDPVLYHDIYAYVKNLYRWELEHGKEIERCGYSVSTMLIPYISPLNNDFKQVRYGEIVINLSPQQLEIVESLHAMCYRTPSSTIVEIDSKIPRLDELIRIMIGNGDIYPYKVRNSSSISDIFSVFDSH